MGCEICSHRTFTEHAFTYSPHFQFNSSRSRWYWWRRNTQPFIPFFTFWPRTFSSPNHFFNNYYLVSNIDPTPEVPLKDPADWFDYSSKIPDRTLLIPIYFSSRVVKIDTKPHCFDDVDISNNSYWLLFRSWRLGTPVGDADDVVVFRQNRWWADMINYERRRRSKIYCDVVCNNDDFITMWLSSAMLLLHLLHSTIKRG